MKSDSLATEFSGSAGTHRRIKAAPQERIGVFSQASLRNPGGTVYSRGRGYSASPALVHGQLTEAVKDAGGTWPVVKSVPGSKRLRRNASANSAAPQERIGEFSGSAGTHRRIRVLRKVGQRCETSPPLQCNLALFEGKIPMKNLRTLTRKFGPMVVGAGALLVGTAHAADPVDAAAALGTLSGTITAFGPVLFGLALASTVIMIGISWIKKGRGAAK